MISLLCFHFEYIFSLFHQTVFGLALVSAPICFDFCPSPDALYSSPFGLSPNSNSILNPWSSISLSGFSHNPKIFRIKQTSKMLDKKKKCWTSKIEGISFIFALKLNQQNLGKGKRTFIFLSNVYAIFIHFHFTLLKYSEKFILLLEKQLENTVSIFLPVKFEIQVI